MVKHSRAAADLDRVFGALSDPTRRAIVARLASGEASVSDVDTPFDVSLPAVTKHLAVLRDAGLVEAEKRGRVRWCRLEARPLAEADRWLRTYRRFWSDRFDGLAAYLETERP